MAGRGRPTKAAKKEEAEPQMALMSIKPVVFEEMVVTIIGQNPLIQNPKTQKTIEGIQGVQSGGQAQKTKKPPRDPRAEYLDKLQARQNGKYAWFPAIGIKKSMVTAAGRYTDEQMTRIRGLFFISAVDGGTEIPIECKHAPAMRTDTGTPPGQRSLHVFYRPEWKTPWSMTFKIKYDSSMLTKEALISLLQRAGISVGLGAWRVESNGLHGTFTVGDNLIVTKRKKVASA